MKWPDIFEHLQDKDDVSQIEYEIKTFSRLSTMLWYSHLPHLFVLNKSLLARLKEKHMQSKRDHVLQQIIGSKVTDPELGSSNYKDIGTIHRDISREKRKNNYCSEMLNFTDRHIEDERLLSRGDDIPILFEEAFMRGDTLDSLNSRVIEIEESEDYQKNKMRVVVLCHGYQGSHVDMLKLSHYFKLVNRDIFYYCSRVNEQDTTEDIGKMGEKLANEIENLVSRYLEENRLESISFVGHSLGGLIIRAALPLLAKYEKYMKTFMTFSTPHLGVSSGDSKLVETGKILQLRFFDTNFMETAFLLEATRLERC